MAEYKMTTTKMRNVFKPKWWQLRRRYHIWRARRERERMLDEMNPEIRQAYEKACQEVERRILFGDSNDKPKGFVWEEDWE